MKTNGVRGSVRRKRGEWEWESDRGLRGRGKGRGKRGRLGMAEGKVRTQKRCEEWGVTRVRDRR